MKDLAEIIVELEHKIKNTRFSKLLKVCSQFFGEPRISGSHHVFTMPWREDPRINLQTSKGAKGKCKPYQVRQVISALKKLQEMEN